MDTSNLTRADEAYIDELVRDQSDGEISIVADLDGTLSLYTEMMNVDLEGASVWQPTDAELHAVARMACDRERGFNPMNDRRRYV